MHKVAFLIERCSSRACDELACDTHPLQCRSLELDMQETSATGVCVSTFSFFLRAKVGRERWAGKNSNRRGVSFRATRTPTVSGSDPRIKQALPLCTCPRLFAGKVGREKVGRENSIWVRSLFQFLQACPGLAIPPSILSS